MQNLRDYRIKHAKGSLPKLPAGLSAASSPAAKVKFQGPRFHDLLAKTQPDDLINTAIEEHFMKLGYLSTYETFLREALEKAQPPQANKSPKNPLTLSDIKEDLFTVSSADQAFKCGDSKVFNKAFQQIEKRTTSQFPDRKFDAWTEMRLHAYLAVYHIHPELKSRGFSRAFL